jgi:hypothetical protein
VVVIFWSRMGTPLPHPEYCRADGGSPTRDVAIDLLRVIGTPAALLGLSELGLLAAEP